MTSLATLAGKLTAGSRRAIVRISHLSWTEEGFPGPARSDAYSLWWGRNGKLKLVEPPVVFTTSDARHVWKWKLTPLGLALRTYIQNQEILP